MPNKNILKHHDNLKGKAAQGALPRYRLRSRSAGWLSEKNGGGDYVFAARFKRAPYWLVISEKWWGTMKEEQFELEYVTSNDESREIKKEREKTLASAQ